MAHTASVGSAKRTVNVRGKRLGVKKFGGEFVKAGEIIIRQKGSKFYPGKNADSGRDFTIFSKISGYVSFRKMTGFKRGQKYVDILAQIPTKVETVDIVAAKPSKIGSKQLTKKTKESTAVKATPKIPKKTTTKSK